jgi:zinc resistance-associated protein
MSNTNIKKGLMVLVVVAVIGFGAYAFAHMGAGFGHQGWMHSGGGMHHYGYGTPGFGYPGDLSDEERNDLDNKRKAFFQSTEDLRGDIYSKQLELQSELAKDQPDNQKALELQNRISKLEAQLDQKSLGHMMKMRKISPHSGREFMGGYHMGYGYGPSDSCWR